MIFDWKKIGLYGGGVAVVGVIGYWLYQYQQQAAAASAANNAVQSQDDAQALQALLAAPLENGSAGDSSAAVTGPTVDTGNNTLQALINSILNPSTGTVSATPTTPVTSTPISSAPSLPSGGGTASPGIGTGVLPPSTLSTQPVQVQNPIVIAPVGSGANPIGIQPGQLQAMPLQSEAVQ
jgi:hypothetical protein